MSIKGKDLRKDFSLLFNKQKRKEESAQMQESKRIFFEQKQYRKLNLKPKKPLNSLSPLFQDPDLLVEITGGNVQFLTGRSILSRRRNVLDSVTTVRPQAKDVSSKRVHEDADLSTTNSVEEGFYYHPKGPKKRVYIAETTDSPNTGGPDSSTVSTPTSNKDSTAQAIYTVAPRLSELALPTHSITTLSTQQDEHEQGRRTETIQVEDSDCNMDEEDENPVLKLGTFLQSTAELLRNSTLDTIKYGGLYRLLPRLTPIKQYKNTNQQYNIVSSECQPQDDTVLTVTIFSEIDKNTRMQEIEILGSQSLRQLRKAIICPFGYGRNYHHYYQNLHNHSEDSQNAMETDPQFEQLQEQNQEESQNENERRQGQEQNIEHSEERNNENNQEQDLQDNQEKEHEDVQEQQQVSDEQEGDLEDIQKNNQDRQHDDTQEVENDDIQEQTKKTNQENDFDFHTLFSADDNSLFFVENTFYTDSKNPRLCEKIITEWLSGKTQKQHTDFAINKKGIRLENLGFELNKPYCFIHYGRCEHMFVVNDIRLLSAVDNVKELPRTLSSLKYTRYKCSMCSIFPATHLTTNDILTGFSPCYFCSICYQSFHANIESETHMEGFESRLYYGDIP